jgi:alkylation response protein AidB-like acyl-CoA dehydrogenase
LAALRRVRAFVDDEVLPTIGDYWERADMPWPLIQRIGELEIVGEDIEGYGCPGLDPIACGLVHMELNRGDGSLGTFLGVQAGLAMKSIAMLGSKEQKQTWLPAMARLEKLGAFALTEPDHGSDSVALETTARRDGDHFVIDGAKRWIGNGSLADVVVVWARGDDGKVSGFLVERDTPRFNAQRQQFGKPLVSFQIVQDRLVKMLAEVTSMQLYCLQIGRLAQRGRLTDTIAGLAKLNNTRKAREICAQARDLLGGNGILLENHVIRHMADIEAIHTYEGTETMQTLIVGRDITGVGAFA